MAVYYRCKVCGGEHPSPIAMADRRSLDTSSFSNNGFQCPKTGEMATYDKKDMFWKDEN